MSPRALKFIPDDAVAEKNNMEVRPLANEHAGLKKTVWVKNGEILQEKEESTGNIGTNQVEITGGLSAGEDVVVGMTTVGPANNGTPPNGNAGNSPFMPQRPGGNRNR